MELQRVRLQCRYDGARWIGIAWGQMGYCRHDQTSAAVRFEDEPAQLYNGRPQVKLNDFD